MTCLIHPTIMSFLIHLPHLFDLKCMPHLFNLKPSGHFLQSGQPGVLPNFAQNILFLPASFGTSGTFVPSGQSAQNVRHKLDTQPVLTVRPKINEQPVLTVRPKINKQSVQPVEQKKSLKRNCYESTCI
eukprot:Pompholyxophrys_sp_v1_NODE_4_length_15125_cov_6.573656.p13 type:complete len:129 gc:universal NODE_4_length_15125_cov_6.573656:398-12(-)